MKTIITSVIAFSMVAAVPLARASYESPPSEIAAASYSLKGAIFVSLPGASGYYVVDSPADGVLAKLGVPDAPYVNSDNISRTGVGLDSIAFRFGADGRLEGFPVYLAQLGPESIYTAKLRSLPPRAKLAMVRELFAGHEIVVKRRGSGTIAYVKVPVYDPLASGS